AGAFSAPGLVPLFRGLFIGDIRLAVPKGSEAGNAIDLGIFAPYSYSAKGYIPSSGIYAPDASAIYGDLESPVITACQQHYKQSRE
ncbi:MAG: hypothetical protein AABM33_00385, partial [Pseudomonadota bacterium]